MQVRQFFRLLARSLDGSVQTIRAGVDLKKVPVAKRARQIG
jgi:hypothetical protein